MQLWLPDKDPAVVLPTIVSVGLELSSPDKASCQSVVPLAHQLVYQNLKRRGFNIFCRPATQGLMVPTPMTANTSSTPCTTIPLVSPMPCLAT